MLLAVVMCVSVTLLGQAAPARRAASEAKSEREKEKEKEEALKKEESQKARKAALRAWRERLKRPVNGYVFEPDSLETRPDSISIVKFTNGVHFLDSLKGVNWIV